MKKGILLTMVSVALFGTVFAQPDQEKRSAFQLSFITPLGTNGGQSAQYTNAVSLNLMVGVSRNETVLTLGGMSNVILNDARGVQIGGFSNYIGSEGRGAQVAGLININANRMLGVQVSGLVNYAGDVRGVQVSGLANRAGDVRGLQVAGFVNIAKKVKGVQLAGLVNVAEESDVPIGFVNIIRKGEMGVALTYDGIGNAVASFRSGGKYTYGILGVGYNHKVKDKGWVVEAGLGAHIPIVKWFRINNEFKASSIAVGAGESVHTMGYSLLPAFRIGKHFELFGGVSLDYMNTRDVTAQYLFPTQSLWKEHGATSLKQLYLGYQVGVHYLF